MHNPSSSSCSSSSSSTTTVSTALQFIAADTALPAQALLLDNTANVLDDAARIAQHSTVVLHFPKWTDGRAYSQAVLLRGRLRYTGQVRATGDVLADMLPLLQRCGFDAVQLRADQSLETAQRALGYFGTRDSHNGAYYQALPPDRAAAVAAAQHGAAP